jgi:photosystem II stability/assembly factor-like uncharacterized protein
MVRRLVSSGLTILALAAAVPAAAQWDALGLSGRSVVRLRATPTRLWACTTAGLFSKSLDPGDTTWTLNGFTGGRVFDFAQTSAGTMLALKDITGAGADTSAIWHSTDGGSSWDPYHNAYGLGGVASPDIKGLMFAVIPGLADGVVTMSTTRMDRTLDGGATWTLVRTGAMFEFVMSDVSSPPRLWAGGETSLFTPFLFRSTNQGASWSFCMVGNGSDDICSSACANPTDPTIVFASLFSDLRLSYNSGASFSFVNPQTSVPSRPSIQSRAYGPWRLYGVGAGAGGGPRSSTRATTAARTGHSTST